jgi:lipoprotein Spr
MKRMLKHIVLAVFLLAGNVLLHAQDTAIVVKQLVFPEDLDPALVDSFYSARSINLNDCENPELYFEVYRWVGTHYRYGGNSTKGIDCSHFVGKMYSKIYGIDLAPDAGSIFRQCKVVKGGLKAAREGDLLFFKIKKGQISHVGIYLQNDMFAHASSHVGVTVTTLNKQYYKHTFYKVGRIEKNE